MLDHFWKQFSSFPGSFSWWMVQWPFCEDWFSNDWWTCLLSQTSSLIIVKMICRSFHIVSSDSPLTRITRSAVYACNSISFIESMASRLSTRRAHNIGKITPWEQPHPCLNLISLPCSEVVMILFCSIVLMQLHIIFCISLFTVLSRGILTMYR